jgi:hypothetical protein
MENSRPCLPATMWGRAGALPPGEHEGRDLGGAVSRSFAASWRRRGEQDFPASRWRRGEQERHNIGGAENRSFAASQRQRGEQDLQPPGGGAASRRVMTLGA